MSDRSGIEWTDATWNPVTGCSEVSPGCDRCYAKAFAERFRGTEGHYYQRGFDVVLRPEKLDQPIRWTRPRLVFVNSMADLFHQAVPDDYIARVFAVMAQAPQHTFQLLTKRHARMRHLLNAEAFRAKVFHHGGGMTWPLPNVWVGVSAENQQWWDTRVEYLLGTPAAVRWVSLEPLLGHITMGTPWSLDPETFRFTGIDWVVVGGESGTGARPMHPEWARSLRDQCAAAKVPFLFKQWGNWSPVAPDEAARNRDRLVFQNGKSISFEHATRTDLERWDYVVMRRAPKSAGGRHLDGQLHDQYPAVTA
ncbi:hypothetical protein SEA_BIPPER_79 [Mycobacterium phage Bipper]|uniref:Phage Gp37/Gp68 family protein n=1 Tax=Mycobacterium phage Bipper TaxID=1805457 RepID=A0A142F2K7_9CAUD|nr:hypothetical protein KCH39_gp098 [Mycobacterium phage Bipper]AMQ67014.1 hypothetical protein SEA_BIPPER_79 [Mycobacterium phage Bipper]